MDNENKNKKRDLGSAEEEPRQRTAGESGKASHDGSQSGESADEESSDSAQSESSDTEEETL